MYNEKNIKILKGLEAVKKRPGMYIGDTTDGSGLHQMLYEVLDNSIDESLSGCCDYILIVLKNDNSILVEDNGRGIPVGVIETEGLPAAQIIMTTLHSGGKFDTSAYKVSGGLHGVGVSVVNALSEFLDLKIFYNGKIYEQQYENGIPTTDFKIVGETKKNGTYIHFKPSQKIFLINEFNVNQIINRLTEISYLNSNIEIKFVIEREKQEYFFKKNTNGIKDYVVLLNDKKKLIFGDVFYANSEIGKYSFSCSMTWNVGYSEILLCYTNNIKQKDGGTHLNALKLSLYKASLDYIRIKKIKTNIQLNSDDIREGIVCVLVVKMPEPKFTSQTKDKLVSSEIKNPLEEFLYGKFLNFLLENPNYSKLFIEKVIDSAKAREAARKAREISRKKNLISTNDLPVKLADCQQIGGELFIVEGASASGTAKQARDRKFQAILPIKGKILNVEKSRLDKILESEEIISIFSSIGIIPGEKKIDYKDQIRYNKIIIMTDADIDGAHITTLLLTFFYRLLKDLVLNGYIYIATPPLYKTLYKKKQKYINNESEFKNYLYNVGLEELKILNEKNRSFLNNMYNLNISILNKLTKIKKNFSNRFCDVLLEISSNYNKFLTDEFITKINTNSKFNLSVKGDFLYIKDVLENTIYKNKIEDFYLNECSEVVQLNNEINNMFIKFKEDENINYKNFYKMYEKIILKAKNSVNIQRYKGLGEMNPSQLEETAMNPISRTIYQVFVDDEYETNKMFYILMGDDVNERKNFILNNNMEFNVDI